MFAYRKNSFFYNIEKEELIKQNDGDFWIQRA